MSELWGLIFDDGYTEKGFIAQRDRLHPALRFEFRPCLAEERALFIRQNVNLGDKEQIARNTKLLKEKLLSWDLKQRSGDTAPIQHDALRRVKPALLERLLGIVLGLDAPDEDPTKSPEEITQDAADKAEANKSGKSFRPNAE
jgi:hypothetical protein